MQEGTPASAPPVLNPTTVDLLVLDELHHTAPCS
jgi:hypothetical protein